MLYWAQPCCRFRFRSSCKMRIEIEIPTLLKKTMKNRTPKTNALKERAIRAESQFQNVKAKQAGCKPHGVSLMASPCLERNGEDQSHRRDSSEGEPYKYRKPQCALRPSAFLQHIGFDLKPYRMRKCHIDVYPHLVQRPFIHASLPRHRDG